MPYTKLSVHFDPGKPGNNVVAILQCPGQDEENASPQHPAAGRTGANLQEVCLLINEMGQDDVDGPTKRTLSLVTDLCYDPEKPQSGVMVANAHRNPYYKGGPNGEKMPLDISCKHIQKIAETISNKRAVICFGVEASRLYEKICSAACCAKMQRHQFVIKCHHLSFMALNRQINYDVDRRPIDRGDTDATERRLKVVAKYIFLRLSGRINSQMPFGVYLKSLNPNISE